jgi:hypothetical protein
MLLSGEIMYVCLGSYHFLTYAFDCRLHACCFVSINVTYGKSPTTMNGDRDREHAEHEHCHHRGTAQSEPSSLPHDNAESSWSMQSLCQRLREGCVISGPVNLEIPVPEGVVEEQNKNKTQFLDLHMRMRSVMCTAESRCTCVSVQCRQLGADAIVYCASKGIDEPEVPLDCLLLEYALDTPEREDDFLRCVSAIAAVQGMTPGGELFRIRVFQCSEWTQPQRLPFSIGREDISIWSAAPDGTVRRVLHLSTRGRDGLFRTKPIGVGRISNTSFPFALETHMLSPRETSHAQVQLMQQLLCEASTGSVRFVASDIVWKGEGPQRRCVATTRVFQRPASDAIAVTNPTVRFRVIPVHDTHEAD